MSKKNISTKIKALIGAGLIASAGLGVGVGSSFFPQIITEEVVVKEIEYQTIVETVNETVEVEVPKEVIVEVDNGNLDLVLQYVYDKEGNLSLVVSGLFDDELDQVVDRLVQLNDWEAGAIDLTHSQFSRELDRQHSFDRRDTSRLKVDKDTISISGVDFEYLDAVISFEVEFRHDGSLHTADVEVEFRDGKALPITISNVN